MATSFFGNHVITGELWIKPELEAGNKVFSYVAIRSDEEFREGYKGKHKNIKTQEHMPGNAVGQAQQNVEVKPINVPSLSLSVKLLNQYDMNTRNKRHRSLSLSLSVKLLNQYDVNTRSKRHRFI